MRSAKIAYTIAGIMHHENIFAVKKIGRRVGSFPIINYTKIKIYREEIYVRKLGDSHES